MIWQIMLVVSIPKAVTNLAKRPGNIDLERKVQSTYCPFGLSSHRVLGCFLALAGQYKPLTRFPFGDLTPVIMMHHETAEQSSMLSSWLIPTFMLFHAYRHTAESVKYNVTREAKN